MSEQAISLINWFKTNFFSSILPRLTTVYFWRQTVIWTKKKKLQFTEIHRIEVFDSDNKWFEKELSIRYWDKNIKTLSTYAFKLENSGNSLIGKDEFIDNESMSIRFWWWVIVWYEIWNWSNDILLNSLNIKYLKNELQVMPFNLNPKEFFTIRVIIDWNIESVDKNIRIKETDIIESSYKGKERKLILAMWLSLFGLLILQVMNDIMLKKEELKGTLDIFNISNYANIYIIIGMLLAILCFAISYISLARFIFKRKGSLLRTFIYIFKKIW